MRRNRLSGAEDENGPQGPGAGTPQGPPSVKGGPWGGGGPNVGGPCPGLPERYMFALSRAR